VRLPGLGLIVLVHGGGRDGVRVGRGRRGRAGCAGGEAGVVHFRGTEEDQIECTAVGGSGDRVPARVGVTQSANFSFLFFIGTEALALLPGQAQPKPSAELKRQNPGRTYLWRPFKQSRLSSKKERRFGVCAIPAKRGRVEHAKFRKKPAPARRSDFNIHLDVPGLRSPALRNFKFDRSPI
jgi:hypothetical protein